MWLTKRLSATGCFVNSLLKKGTQGTKNVLRWHLNVPPSFSRLEYPHNLPRRWFGLQSDTKMAAYHYEVPDGQLDKLQNIVKGSPYKTDNDMHMTQLVRNYYVTTFVTGIKSGKVQGKIFTDGWPQFTCVAVAVTVPRISEVVDIYTHSTNHRKLMQLLREADLITWGKMQVINMGLIGNVDHALKLVSATKPPPDKPNLPGFDVVHHSRLMCMTEERNRALVTLIEDSKFSYTSLLGDGYSLGKLEPHHAEYVASHVHSYPTTSEIQTRLTDYIPSHDLFRKHFVPYFEYLIKNFASVAIYTKKGSSIPVAWLLMKPNHPGHQYVVKEHRRMGLGAALLAGIGKAAGAGPLTSTVPIGDYRFDDYGYQQVGDFIVVLHPGEKKTKVHHRL